MHAIAGPVDAATFLREARWAVETRKKAVLDSRGDKRRIPYLIRAAHQERLANEYGVRINFNQINSNTAPEQFANYIPYYLAYSRGSAPNYAVAQGGGGCWGAGGQVKVSRASMSKVAVASAAGNGDANGAKVHMLLGMYPLAKVDRLYKSVWEKILNEKVSVTPVQVAR